MKGSFTLIQNLLTLLIIPFLACIVGIAAVPAIALFTELREVLSNGEYWIDHLATGISLGMSIVAWGVTLVILCGALGGLLRPRLDPGRYPLESFLTIQWAWSMVFHKIALFFLPHLVPSFIGNLYYRLSGAKIGRGAQINLSLIHI